MNGNPSFDGYDIERITSSSSLSAVNQQSQGVAALLVMLAVLLFIFAYCCWGAPFCRSLCKKYCCCQLEDPESVDVSQFNIEDRSRMVATPTIILLPHGRMLVVDSTVFNQFQTDNTGLDLVELSGRAIQMNADNPRIINRHQLQSSHGSILTTDGESPSKDSLTDNRFPPPTYESIYGGKEEGSVPPSYSDILLHRFATLPYDIDVIDATYGGSKEELEMRSLGSESGHRIIPNPINSFYSMANNFSSQSIACARNSSLNLDGYFLNSACHFEQDIHPQVDNINSISSLYINSNDEFPQSRNETSLCEENNINQNGIENSRNIAREEPQSNFNLELDETFRNNERNRDAHTSNNRILSIENFPETSFNVNSADSDDPRDFQVLPDIRESRV
ncbi:uncharacterized protein LOC122504478 [Leptopilina heterotoma]|uniref:uncharacterized protein LOC122504478 n=1 Tax=Leptopilina heterotoma TaxID=63436 RepID=UPI001CA9844F|nr:uncharacterized protein LOC122504478 [Leptopilina heterotoma]